MTTVPRGGPRVYQATTARVNLNKTEVSVKKDAVAAANIKVEAARVGDVEAAKVSKTEFSLESAATPVTLNGRYASTNHYIRQSRGYVKKDGKLCQFFYLPLMSEAFVVYSFLALFAFLHLWAATAVLGLSLLWFLIFCQHLHVIRGTLPYVLKQPIISNHDKENWFYKLKFSQLEGVFLKAREEGIGVVVMAEGAIKFQVFNLKAKGKMTTCKGHSILMFIISVLQIFWGILWIVANVISGGLIFKINIGQQMMS